MTDITKHLKEAEHLGGIALNHMKGKTNDTLFSYYPTDATAFYLAAIYEQNKAIIALLQEKKGDEQ
jgi:hypothetical protein